MCWWRCDGGDLTIRTSVILSSGLGDLLVVVLASRPTMDSMEKPSFGLVEFCSSVRWQNGCWSHWHHAGSEVTSHRSKIECYTTVSRTLFLNIDWIRRIN
ncbi:hypothetical protein CEXT_96781 [Caerostris extrusa]|uniref:Secreted protein n=1 Tax=Caerostris extrusa TaxID=172846 RepID=A0AAV4U714_CAEEX|nr:hypothetical protein CEXT_96781 [Caerostris extrusa]